MVVSDDTNLMRWSKRMESMVLNGWRVNILQEQKVTVFKDEDNAFFYSTGSV